MICKKGHLLGHNFAQCFSLFIDLVMYNIYVVSVRVSTIATSLSLSRSLFSSNRVPACECHLPLPKTISLDVLGKLLTVGISDPSRNLNNCSSFCINLGIFFSSLCIWKIVLAGFDAPFRSQISFLSVAR